MQECGEETGHWRRLEIGSWRLEIVGKMEMLEIQCTHCLTQVLMRLGGVRVPQTGRKRRLVKELIEDGVIGPEQEVIVAEVDLSALEVLDWSVETPDTEEEQEIEELMNETCSWLDSEEESSESEEEEEEMFWEGIIET